MDFFIVTPSFNQKRFLKQMVQGVLNQKGDFSVIHWVFDGGSTDGSQKLLRSFSKKIHWQSKKDNGQTHALNKGIKILKTWLVNEKKDPSQVIFAQINSDDYYALGAFRIVAELFMKNPTKNWLVGDCKIIDSNGHEIHQLIRWYKKLWRKILSFWVLSILNPIPQPATFLRASAIVQLGNYDEKLHYAMDYGYWLKTWKKLGSPIQTGKILAHFRLHDNSKGMNGFEKQFGEQLKTTGDFVRNPAILFIQWLHNKLTVFVYKIIK